MKSRIAAIVAACLLAVLLAGCGDDATPASAPTATSTTDAGPAKVEASKAPLVAQTPRALDADEAEVKFLTTVRDRLSKIRTQIPDATDEQLLDAAHEACDRLAAGESGENMSLIEGETKAPDDGYYMDSGAIIIAARMTICPIEG